MNHLISPPRTVTLAQCQVNDSTAGGKEWGRRKTSAGIGTAASSVLFKSRNTWLWNVKKKNIDNIVITLEKKIRILESCSLHSHGVSLWWMIHFSWFDLLARTLLLGSKPILATQEAASLQWVKFRCNNRSAGRVNNLSSVVVWGEPEHFNSEQVKPVGSVNKCSPLGHICAPHMWNMGWEKSSAVSREQCSNSMCSKNGNDSMKYVKIHKNIYIYIKI